VAGKARHTTEGRRSEAKICADGQARILEEAERDLARAGPALAAGGRERMSALVLDAGALIAIDRGAHVMHARHEGCHRRQRGAARRAWRPDTDQ
jgi:predicted ribosome-associated RNA-binding protein Tma20